MNFEERVKGIMPRSIYVLECEDGFYYVGESSTKSLGLRFRQQQGYKEGYCKQADFCALHKPIKMIKVVDLGDCDYHQAEIIENAFTKFYATIYGSDKVSGGVACLSDDKKKEISSDTKEEILSAVKIGNG